MADSSPPIRTQDIARGNTQIKESQDDLLELDRRSQSTKSDASDLDALADEFNEAEKAAAGAETPGDEILAPKGSICEVKEIFDTQTSDCACCTEWVDEKPGRDRTEENETAENRRAQFSIIRRLKPHGAGGWKTHSILVNSRSIRAALGKVFDGYPVTYADDDKLELTPKNIPFCHRWDKLLEVERDEPDAETKRHLTLLRSTLEIDLADSLQRRDLVARTGLASSDDLELLFEPGQILIKRSGSVMTAGVAREVTRDIDFSCKPTYIVEVDTTAWNGERFGVAEKTWQLNSFKGTRKVHSLDIFPLHTHPDREKISRELIERGKKYERLRGQHFVEFAGEIKSGHVSNAFICCRPTYLIRAEVIQLMHLCAQVTERVIIDEDFYWELGERSRPKLKPFKELNESNLNPDEDNRANHDNGSANTADTEDDYHSDIRSDHHIPLTNNQLLLCCRFVGAFRLKTKGWQDLPVEQIREIDWISDMMSRLVLNQDMKDLIVALFDYKTTRATDNEQNFDDFVPGKGKGIVMLLCGPPGVGKTLTAEAVSEHSKSPLYRINVQDLGSQVSDMERGLKKAMRRCSHWNGVLLLDEADVFLEQRSVNSLERNELVSSKLSPVRPASSIVDSRLTSRDSFPPRAGILPGRHDSHIKSCDVDRPSV